MVIGIPDAGGGKDKAEGATVSKSASSRRRIIVLTIFFMLLGLSNAGISNFGVVALMSGYGVTFSAANIALTAFLGASAAGVLAGGYLADRTQRHGQVAAACFAINAVIMLVIATVNLPAIVLTVAMGIAGFLGGVIAPSRDMLVRNAAPPGAAGRAFAIVSTGFNFSGIVSSAAVRLDHGPEHAALGVRRLGGVHGRDGVAGAGHRPQAAGGFRTHPPPA